MKKTSRKLPRLPKAPTGPPPPLPSEGRNKALQDAIPAGDGQTPVPAEIASPAAPRDPRYPFIPPCELARWQEWEKEDVNRVHRITLWYDDREAYRRIADEFPEHRFFRDHEKYNP